MKRQIAKSLRKLGGRKAVRAFRAGSSKGAARVGRAVRREWREMLGSKWRRRKIWFSASAQALLIQCLSEEYRAVIER